MWSRAAFHVVARGLVAAADTLRERDLLVDRQEGRLADLLQVNLEVAAVRGHGRRLGGLRLLKEGGGAVVLGTLRGGRYPVALFRVHLCRGAIGPVFDAHCGSSI
jgi:hypothetical protein